MSEKKVAYIGTRMYKLLCVYIRVAPGMFNYA